MKTNNSKTLLLVTPYFPPLIGGAEKQALLLAQGFVRTGYQVTVIFRKRADNSVNYRAFSTLPYTSFLSLIKLLIKYRSNQIVIINSLFLFPGKGVLKNLLEALVIALIKFLNTCIILRLPCVTAPLLQPAIIRYMLKNTVDLWLPISSQQITELKNNNISIDRIIPLPNLIIPISGTKVVSPSLSIPTRIIYIGRLINSKGLSTLIDAISKVKYPISLILFLSLPQTRYKPVTDQLQLLNKIPFPFTVKFEIPSASKYLVPNSIGVFPSLSEGGGNVLREMIAAGMAVIASNLPACTDIITDNQNGLLFPAGNSTMLAKKINYLLANPKKIINLGQAARQTALLMGNQSIIVNKLINQSNSI